MSRLYESDSRTARTARAPKSSIFFISRLYESEFKAARTARAPKSSISQYVVYMNPTPEPPEPPGLQNHQFLNTPFI